MVYLPGKGWSVYSGNRVAQGVVSLPRKWVVNLAGSSSYGSNEEEAYHNAMAAMDSMDYDVAEMMLKEIILQDTVSLFPLAAAKKLFSITTLTNQDFAGLILYYDSTASILSDSVFDLLTEYLKTSCDIQEGNYPDAISWYENMILSPPSFEDSVFSLADLGDTYLLMEADTGLKSSQSGYIGILSQYKPAGKQIYKKQREEWTRLLFNEKKIESEIHNQTTDKDAYFISQNCPNPFESSTIVKFFLPVPSKIHFIVSDILGRDILRHEDKILEKGFHDETIDMKGKQPGIYVISLISNGISVEKCKMIKC